jgi:DeoR family transcriptional regulator of aga operon
MAEGNNIEWHLCFLRIQTNIIVFDYCELEDGITGDYDHACAELLSQIMADSTQSGNGVSRFAEAEATLSAPRDKQENRLATIQKMLQQSGTVSVEELRAKLDVSVVTVRRDLDILEQRGLLRRTHGGAQAIEPLFYEPFRNDRSFQAQVSRFAEEKRRIGRAAAELIQPGENIALTPGTTTTEVVRGIPLNHNVTVVTNTVNIAMELSKRKDVNVFVTGGYLRGEWFSLIGPAATHAIENVVIHTLFIGADGIDPAWGATCFSPDEANLNATMVKHARRKVAVVDHSKFGVVAGWQICRAGDLDVLVTDNSATDEVIAPFKDIGIQILRV